MVQQESSPKDIHPEGLTDVQETLAVSLFEIGAIKFGAFRLKLHDTHPDAPLSPYYVDLRVLPRHPDALREVARVYGELAKNTQGFDACLGIPDAGNSLATAFALETGMPQICLRKEEKTGHGLGGSFMTPFTEGERVLLIDDLVTRADSKLEAIAILEGAGLKVSDVVVLVDREQGGREQLTERGYRLHAAFTFSQLLDFYHRVGKIDASKYQEARDYLRANS